MVSKTIGLENLQKGIFELEKTSSKMSLSDVFAEREFLEVLEAWALR